MITIYSKGTGEKDLRDNHGGLKINCGDPRTKEQIKPRGSWNAEKPGPYQPSCLYVVTVNEFQVLLSSITSLHSYSIGRRYLPYFSPHPVYVPHPISKWPTRPLSHSLYPGYKSGLRTPIHHHFSLELAHCSNSVSHCNKLYSSLNLPHVWKFFWVSLSVSCRGMGQQWPATGSGALGAVDLGMA